MPRYTVICDWTDDCVEDADEIQISARSAAGATSKARRVWSETKGAEWPACRLTSVRVLTTKLIKKSR